jgi:hypothetical protein
MQQFTISVPDASHPHARGMTYRDANTHTLCTCWLQRPILGGATPEHSHTCPHHSASHTLHTTWLPLLVSHINTTPLAMPGHGRLAHHSTWDTLEVTNMALGTEFLPCAVPVQWNSPPSCSLFLNSAVPRCKRTLVRHHEPNINLCGGLRANPLTSTASADTHHAPTAGASILYTHSIFRHGDHKTIHYLWPTNIMFTMPVPKFSLPILNTATS